MNDWTKQTWKGTDHAPTEQAYLGNGLIGWRLSPNPLDGDGRLYVGGFTGLEAPEGIHTTIEIPNPLHVQVGFPGEPCGKILPLGQDLDIYRAHLESDLRIESGSGRAAKLWTRHVVYRNVPCLAGCQMKIIPEQSGDVEIRLCPEKPRGHGVLRDCRAATHTRVHTAEMRLEWGDLNGKHRCGAMMVPVVENASTQVEYRVTSSGSAMGADRLVVLLKDLRSGEPVEIQWLMAVVGDTYHPEPTRQAGRMVQWGFQCLGFKELLQGHEKQWAEIWKGRPRIESDDDSQRASDGSMFYLHSSIHASSRHSLAPFGLSSNGYYGHVFWDCETWTFPCVLLQAPEAAKRILEFRLAGLGQACRQADLFGYRGAMFPWEAAPGGFEDTPMWGETGYLEHHITPDVAFAFWQYQCVTGDEEFLYRGTWPVLREVARWVCSRVEKTGRGYEIRHVTSADEFTLNVDNSAHTNLACVMALRIAMACAQQVGVSPPAEWATVASKMVVPRMADGTIMQHDGWSPDWVSKQADTALAIYPLGIIRDPEDIARIIRGHIKIDPDATATVAMGDQINAVICARHGNRDLARMTWDRGWKPFWIDTWSMYSETVQRRPGCFVTGCGGLLQAVLMGFPGLQLDQPGFAHHPVAMPAGWKSIECDQLYFNGRAHRLVAEQGRDQARLEPLE